DADEGSALGVVGAGPRLAALGARRGEMRHGGHVLLVDEAGAVVPPLGLAKDVLPELGIGERVPVVGLWAEVTEGTIRHRAYLLRFSRHWGSPWCGGGRCRGGARPGPRGRRWGGPGRRGLPGRNARRLPAAGRAPRGVRPWRQRSARRAR